MVHIINEKCIAFPTHLLHHEADLKMGWEANLGSIFYFSLIHVNNIHLNVKVKFKLLWIHETVLHLKGPATHMVLDTVITYGDFDSRSVMPHVTTMGTILYISILSFSDFKVHKRLQNV